MAGRHSVADRVGRLVELLERQRFCVDVLNDLDVVAARANALHAKSRLRALVGVGGDGTAAELVNRVVPGVPLAILPAGTSNLLARQLGLSADPEQVSRAIVAGNLLHLDAGSANGRLFLVMLGCGFDADVVARVHEHRKRIARGGHISYASYAKPILQSIRSYAYPEIHVVCADAQDGETAEQELAVRWVFVCNLPLYGWGVPLAPGAEGTDGLLDLCTFGGGSLWHGLKYAAMIQLGQHQRLADFCHRQGPKFRVFSERPVGYQMDGDPGGCLPVEVEVLRGRVTLVVPEKQ